MVNFNKLIPHDTKIDFVAYRKVIFLVAAMIVALSIGSFFARGLNFGIDFRGGVSMDVRAHQSMDVSALRQMLPGDVTISEIGSNGTDFVLSIPNAEDEQIVRRKVSAIKQSLAEYVTFRKIDQIGPKVGREMIDNARFAIILTLGMILIYVWLRFEWQFALCAVLALAHDCIVLLGMYSLFHYFEFNLNAVVALLTTASYSVHDTVVLFDRIRENLSRISKNDLSSIVNNSINETLSRTVLTSATTLLSLLALCIFGGKIIFDFCFPIVIGLLFGTFSSIFLAAPLLLLTGLERK